MQRMAQAKTVFDQDHYLRLIECRGNFIRKVLPNLKSALGLETALDAGCGVGFFAEILADCGLLVRAFDGRQQNILEAKARCNNISFEQGDIQDSRILSLGSFDIVLCFGLLYHLENPFQAIRHLRSLTEKCLLVESMCLPGAEPLMALRKEPSLEDQSLTDVAFYASESCLVKMLYRSGFSRVYRATRMPEHDDFRTTHEHERRRTVLLASRVPVSLTEFEAIAEPREDADPWAKGENGSQPARSSDSFGDKVKPLAVTRRFWGYSRDQKIQAIYSRWRRWCPRIPFPIQLSSGKWWLATGSPLDEQLIWQGGFEQAEMRFVRSFLQRGMTALDVGAHHGLYTLLLSQSVGERGRVIAFEPSDRERRQLQRHVQLNRCSNVTIEPVALGAEENRAKLFLPENGEDWCNSLRPPVVSGMTRTVEVQVCTLDAYIQRSGIQSVDFVKLDVEGAELSVLKGAHKLLNAKARPAWLVEIFEIRTKPWGYAAQEIIDFMRDYKYSWFEIANSGRLCAWKGNRRQLDANFVAVPDERVAEVVSF